MGAAESRPPPSYVMEYFEVNQRVSYKSQHGFETTCVVVGKRFSPEHNCFVYNVRQDSGGRNRGAFPWQLKALSPPPAAAGYPTSAGPYGHPQQPGPYHAPMNNNVPPPAYTPTAQTAYPPAHQQYAAAMPPGTTPYPHGYTQSPPPPMGYYQQPSNPVAPPTGPYKS
ncbi:uncharacterized protein MONBRDRAFT_12695 [Monosiga brevicollis MX1]|uniref:Uncharacterized protein n=1 Tax=Monosiga brevicollis TaxID=81824 RepID=A9VD17_MONBE|nr:uncharacterized protein MONBRDRAFT_12695 [Monosiga brevicollis MX1]EDQ84565.1 predicted protein [Monosiga brevicollis MX1]|eukprot:XP_001750592.1 hypothetical protein [Monosiga brevicollis MX1]